MRIGQYETHPAADVFPLMEGDEYAALVEDIRRYGLREPIVRADHGAQWKILDGRNRLRACIDTKTPPKFREYDGHDPIAFVLSLNLARRHLNESQRGMVAARVETLKQGRPEKDANWQVSRKEAAASLNVGERTVARAKEVIEKAVPEVVRAVDRGDMAVSAAAELSRQPADKQREIAARVGVDEGKEIRGGLVRAYVKQAEKAEVAKRLDAEPVSMPSGPFHVIVSDPPWAYEKRAGDATHRGDLPYPPMTTEAICALSVADMAHEDCILWLWTTNAFMRDAYRVLDAWGFSERTILTWAKDRMGLGDWLRGQTEHCILAVRGKPVVTLTNETTLLHGPLREHSRKPDEFYALVEKLCHGSKVEMFSREPRDGWARWGAETEKFDAA